MVPISIHTLLGTTLLRPSKHADDLLDQIRKIVEDWCRQQCETQSVRELAGKLRTDHANLDKILKGKRLPSYRLIGTMTI